MAIATSCISITLNMDISILLVAFGFGLVFKQFNVPPLVGYLVAGFVLNFAGYTLSPTLQEIADLGITIMLFTIGLKLNVRDLAKVEIWGVCASFTVVWIAAISLAIGGLSVAVPVIFPSISMHESILIGFMLSFSSTVCVVKVLEESGELKTRHGRLAIGILVMQDILAVVYLVVATGKIPSLYSPALLLLPPLTPIFKRILAKSGHGELLPLTGFVFALGSYHLFELLSVKGDLGALIAGVLLASDKKASELSKSLLAFKDLFLIGFFLSIGLTALPSFDMVGAALVLCVFIALKASLYFGLGTLLGLRARTAFLSSIVLSNFSEFGLIVGALAVSVGALNEYWLVTIALAVSFSFVFTSIVYRNSHNQYAKRKRVLKQYEKPKRLKEDIYPTLPNVEFLVVGMGRVGTGAYSSLTRVVGDKVWGMDADTRKVAKLNNKGIKTITGDGEDIDLWDNIDIHNIKLVLLALPSIEDAANITKQLSIAGYTGKVAAIARYEDEVTELLERGVDKVFNFFAEAGVGFAEESLQFVGINNKTNNNKG